MFMWIIPSAIRLTNLFAESSEVVQILNKLLEDKHLYFYKISFFLSIFVFFRKWLITLALTASYPEKTLRVWEYSCMCMCVWERDDIIQYNR